MGVAKRARPVGFVLIGVAALFAAEAIVFVPEAGACLPGFKPKPGVTNPTDNARDCEPEGGSSSPPAPQGGSSSPLPPQGGAAAPPEPRRSKEPPTVSPSEQRKKVEDRLKRRPKDDERAAEPSAPKAPPPGKSVDDAIKRMGKKLKEDKGPVLSLEEIEQLMINAVVERIGAMVELVQVAESTGLVCSDPSCPDRQEKLDLMKRHYIDGEPNPYGDWIDEMGGPVWAGLAEALSGRYPFSKQGGGPPPTPAPPPAPTKGPSGGQTDKRERN